MFQGHGYKTFFFVFWSNNKLEHLIRVRVKQRIYFPLISIFSAAFFIANLSWPNLTCLSPSPNLSVPPPLAYYASPSPSLVCFPLP